MARVIWVIHAACPSRCAYCAIESQDGKRSLPEAEARRVAEEIVALGYEQVILVGGEPLLYPHLPAVLDVLAGRTEVALFTGGIPGDPRRSLDKMRVGVDRVVLSIDVGIDAENDLVRGRKGITRDVLALAEALRQDMPHVGLSVNTVVSRANVRALPSVWERMAPFRVDSWALTLAGDNFGASPAGQLPSREAIETLYRVTIPALARTLSGHAELVVLPIPLPLLEQRVPPSAWDAPRWAHDTAVNAELDRFAVGDHNASFVARYGCPLAGRDVSIGVEGEVYPCSQAPILEPKYVVGHTGGGLRAALEGGPMRAFVGGVPHAPCRRCWAPSNVDRPVLEAVLARARAGAS
jgi:hypothetical protein